MRPRISWKEPVANGRTIHDPITFLAGFTADAGFDEKLNGPGRDSSRSVANGSPKMILRIMGKSSKTRLKWNPNPKRTVIR